MNTVKKLTDPALAQALIDHWAHRADLDYIRRDLERRGKDLTTLTVNDLASYDQLHSGQLTATREFAAWVAPEHGARVIDLGAGLGGSARLLAAEHGCHVEAVELSKPLHETGAELTGWLKLSSLVQHHCGDVLAEGPDDGFDLVWLQHVDMHMPNKDRLYARCVRALAPRGRLVWHDWLAGSHATPHYPMPWSDDGQMSFLSPLETFREDTQHADLTLNRLEDTTERTHHWFTSTLAGLNKALARLPDNATRRRARFSSLANRVENVLRNLDEKRLLPFFGEATGPGGGPHRG